MDPADDSIHGGDDVHKGHWSFPKEFGVIAGQLEIQLVPFAVIEPDASAKNRVDHETLAIVGSGDSSKFTGFPVDSKGGPEDLAELLRG
jgi:hypothetical protein